MMNFLLAPEKSNLTGFLGALHPGVVHFPIALLSVAALLEILQMARKRKELAGGTVALTFLAALSAIPAAFFGFSLADYDSAEGPLVDLHKWLGLASTATAIVAAGLALKSKGRAGVTIGLRVLLILGSGLVLATGYYGGEMQDGEGHILKFLFPKEPVKTPDEPVGSGTIDFVRDIAPIIRESCLKCHGGEKTKAKLKLTTKADAMKGGESGKCINPGKPTLSSFYTLLIDKDPDVRMPEKSKPLPEAQIESVRKWIEQGALWPDGYGIKK